MNTLYKMQKARAALIMQQPFFGTLAVKMKMVERNDIQTMAVDGVHMYYNPQFVDALPGDQLLGIIAHEVMHCACNHHTRRNGRDQRQWNIAGDYAINGILNDSGFALPSDALLDPQFDGMSAEAIYNAINRKSPEQEAGGDDQGDESASSDQDLEDDQQNDAGDGLESSEDGSSDNQGEGDQQGAGDAPSDAQGDGDAIASVGDVGGCGEVLDHPAAGQGEDSTREAEQDMRVALAQAVQIAKKAGNMPGSLERIIQNELEPMADWRELLSRFMSQFAKDDYSWSRPNRRYIHNGMYLPSLHSEHVPDIVVAIDTSGSVNQEMLDQFASELNAIVSDVRPSETHVIYCDTQVQGIETFTPDDQGIVLYARGGGGTDFVPVFEAVEEFNIEPACLIYLTDLFCNSYPPEPDYPVLWVKAGDFVSPEDAPFGDTINMQS